MWKKYFNRKSVGFQLWTSLEVILNELKFVYESYGIYRTLYTTVALVGVAILNWALPTSSRRLRKRAYDTLYTCYGKVSFVMDGLSYGYIWQWNGHSLVNHYKEKLPVTCLKYMMCIRVYAISLMSNILSRPQPFLCSLIR